MCHICGKSRAVPLFERAMSRLSWPAKLALGFAGVLLLGLLIVFAFWLHVPGPEFFAPFLYIVLFLIALALALGKLISWAIRSGRNSWE